MRVFLPATAAALAASVIAADAEARTFHTGAADNTAPAASAEETVQGWMEQLARKVGKAEQAICEGIETYSGAPFAMIVEDQGNKIVAYPNIGHFSQGSVTFEPTKISIDWTDKAMDEETGFSLPLPGVTQTIDLIDDSGALQGFEGAGLRDSYGQAMNCSIEGIASGKGRGLEVQCTDSLAQRTAITITPDLVTLTYRFELALSPLDNTPVECMWGYERPRLPVLQP